MKHKILIFALVSLTAAWLLTIYVFMPQWDDLDQQTASYQQEKQKLQVVEAYAIDHPNIDEHLAELDVKRASLDKLLPNSGNFTEYLLQVETAAKASGVKIIGVKPTQPVDKGQVNESMFEVVVRGTYFQTLDFVKRLDEGPRFNFVSAVAMRADQGVLESKLSILIYNTK